jgi:hypothetical protein
MKSVLCIFMVVVFLAFGGIALLSYLQKRSLRIAEQAELMATYDRWVEAGQPYGDALAEFMRGRGGYFLVDTQRYDVSGKSFVGILARTNLMSESRGRYVITTNRVVLVVNRSGGVQLARYDSWP